MYSLVKQLTTIIIIIIIIINIITIIKYNLYKYKPLSKYKIYINENSNECHH